MRCAVCHAFASDDATTCPHCGAPLRASSSAPSGQLRGVPLAGSGEPTSPSTEQPHGDEGHPDTGHERSRPGAPPSPPKSTTYPWQEGPMDVRGGAFQRLVTWVMAHVWHVLGGVVLLLILAIALGKLGTLIDWILGLAFLGLAVWSIVRRPGKGLAGAVVLALVGVALLVAGVRGLGAGPKASPAVSSTAALPGTTVTLHLTGNIPWTDTGLDLSSGDTVHIVASGIINNGSIYSQIANNSPAGQGTVTAQGGCTAAVTPQQGFLAPGLPCWALIGRVGAGAPFAVGTQATWKVKAPGELWLGVNNNVFGHSTGSWTVTITVSPPR